MTQDPSQTAAVAPKSMGFSWSRLHAILAVVAGFVLPAASWIDGSGWLAWTMYSRSGSYRLSIYGRDASSSRSPIAPSALAARAAGPLRPALGGADHWRFSPFGPTLRRYLPGIGELACGVRDARSIELVLEEQSGLDAPIVKTAVSVACPNH